MSVTLGLSIEAAKVVYDVLVAEWDRLQEQDNDGAKDETIRTLDLVTEDLSDLIFNHSALESN